MRCFFIVLGTLIALLVNISPSSAKPVCGGIEPNGKLQKACENQPGKLMGAPVVSCPAGQIYDLEACWVCPSGFVRSADSIATKTACHRVTNKDIFSDVKRASKLSKASFCPKGSFFDLHNGGGCWSCPSGYRRTVFPVHEDKACETGSLLDGLKWLPANFTSATCGSDDAFYDLIDGGSCWTCPKDYKRTVFPVNGKKACGRPLFEAKPAKKIKKAGCKVYGDDAFWDPKKTKGTVIGSCWQCPSNHERSLFPVDSNQACNAPNIAWDMPKLPQKGVFLLDGAAEVAIALIKERTKLEKVAVDLGKAIGINRQQAIDDLWREMAQYPEENLALRYVMLKHILDISLDNKKRVAANSPEGRLIRSFEGFISGYKAYLAQESLTAYDNWFLARKTALKKRQEEDAKHMRSNMLMLFSDQMPVPPDFRQVIARSALINMAAATPTIGLFSSNFIKADDGSLADQMIYKIFNNRTEDLTEELSEDFLKEFADETTDLGKAAVKTLGEGDEAAAVAKNFTGAVDDVAKTAANAGKTGLTAGKLASKMMAISGPQIAFEFFILVFEAELTKNIDKADARPILERYLHQAKSYRPSLRTISQNKDDAPKIFSYWALAATGNAKPKSSLLAQIKKASNENLAKHELVSDPLVFQTKDWTWYNVAGSAAQISSGLAGDVWHVSKNGDVYTANIKSDKKWQKTKISNAMKVAAMATAKTAFILDKDGAMSILNAGKHRKISGWAADIAVNSEGVKWHVGGNNSIYTENQNGNWRRVNGPKATKIAAGPGDIAWIIDTNNNLHYHFSGKWTNANKKAKDVALGVNGAVWITGMNSEAYRLIHNNRWEPLKGGSIDRLGSGSVASLWAIRPDNAIILFQHDQDTKSPMAEKGMFKDSTTTVTQSDGISFTQILIDQSKVTKTTVVSDAFKGPAKWTDVAGQASQISTSSSGDVWHIGGKGNLYVRLSGQSGWLNTGLTSIAEIRAKRLAGQAFALDANGNMWDVWSNGKKRQVPGWASNIAVDSQDVKWHVGGNSTIYQMGTGGWVKMPGRLSRVSAGKDGATWAVGLNREIYRFADQKWARVPGAADEVAVGSNGSVWHIGGSNTIYRLDGKDWQKVDAQKAISLSIGLNDEIWIVRPNGTMAVYR